MKFSRKARRLSQELHEQEKAKDPDDYKDDGVLILFVSSIVVFLWAFLTNHSLRESAAIAPVIGLVLTFVFAGMRDLVRKLLKK